MARLLLSLAVVLCVAVAAEDCHNFGSCGLAVDDELVALQVEKTVRVDAHRPILDQAEGGGAFSGRETRKPIYRGIKVVNAGLLRTGTESTMAALKELGYTPPGRTSRMGAPGDRSPEDLLDALELNGMDGLFDGSANTRGGLFQPEQDSRVVLTMHPKGADGWVASNLRQARWYKYNSNYDVGDIHEPLKGCKIQIHPNITKLSDEMHQTCSKLYESYNTKIMEQVPEEKILLFNVTQGWAPLCNFLGRPVPEIPFPHVDFIKDRRDQACECGLNCADLKVNGRSPQLGDEELLPLWECDEPEIFERTSEDDTLALKERSD